MPASTLKKLSRTQLRLRRRLLGLSLSKSERLFVENFYGDRHSYATMAALLDLTIPRVRELHESLLARESASRAERAEQQKKSRHAKRTKR